MLNYIKKHSSRRKNIAIQIKNDQVFLLIPKARLFQSQKKIDLQAEKFLKSKESWIKSKLEKETKIQNPIFQDYSNKTFQKYKEKAEQLCYEKVKYWSKKM